MVPQSTISKTMATGTFTHKFSLKKKDAHENAKKSSKLNLAHTMLLVQG